MKKYLLPSYFSQCEYICSNSLDLLDMDISFEDAMQCSKLADLLKSFKGVNA